MKTGTFLRNKSSRDRDVRSCPSPTNWTKRSNVIISGRVQKEERCVGQSEGRDSMGAGSLKIRVIRGLPASPSSALILSWASAKRALYLWYENVTISDFVYRLLNNQFTPFKDYKEYYLHVWLFDWWKNHRRVSPTVVVLLWRTD